MATCSMFEGVNVCFVRRAQRGDFEPCLLKVQLMLGKNVLSICLNNCSGGGGATKKPSCSQIKECVGWRAMSARIVSSTIVASKYSSNRKALSLWLTRNSGRKRGSSCVVRVVLKEPSWHRIALTLALGEPSTRELRYRYVASRELLIILSGSCLMVSGQIASTC